MEIGDVSGDVGCRRSRFGTFCTLFKLLSRPCAWAEPPRRTRPAVVRSADSRSFGSFLRHQIMSGESNSWASLTSHACVDAYVVLSTKLKLMWRWLHMYLRNMSSNLYYPKNRVAPPLHFGVLEPCKYLSMYVPRTWAYIAGHYQMQLSKKRAGSHVLEAGLRLQIQHAINPQFKSTF